MVFAFVACVAHTVRQRPNQMPAKSAFWQRVAVSTKRRQLPDGWTKAGQGNSLIDNFSSQGMVTFRESDADFTDVDADIRMFCNIVERFSQYDFCSSAEIRINAVGFEKTAYFRQPGPNTMLGRGKVKDLSSHRYCILRALGRDVAVQSPACHPACRGASSSSDA